MDYIKQQWAVKNKINPSYFFTQGAPPPVPQAQQDQVNAIQESSVNKISRQNPMGVQQAARQGKGA